MHSQIGLPVNHAKRIADACGAKAIHKGRRSLSPSSQKVLT